MSKVEQTNPREFQINQLRRRFRPQETDDDLGSTLTFGLAPSDPDFPFELESLQCVLHVPFSYPGKGRPALKVTNSDMAPGFQENVARGFDDMVDFTLRTSGQGNLLNWMKALDRQLERLLTTLERGPKLTFVPNIGASSEATSSENAQIRLPVSHTTTAAPTVATKAPKSKPPPVKPTYTAEERAQAEKRRATETKQIEARLGRLPMFQKRPDGVSFIVPIQPTKQDRLPRTLQAVKTVKLLVPHLYPLERSFIEIQGVDSTEARSAEVGFAQWIEQNSQLNLVSQINYLASNLHNFAKTPLPEEREDVPLPVLQTVDEPTEAPPVRDGLAADTEDRPHLHVIPRPPEWSVPDGNSDDETTEESSYDEDSFEEEEEEEDGGAPVPAIVDKPPGKGVALSFPFMELYGIELLELTNLYITVKCERCKESLDVKNVPQAKDEKDVSPKVESCRKCANSMSIGESN